MPGSLTAAARWADGLAGWVIPDDILEVAPEPPWGFPPTLFVASARTAPADDEGRRVARQALDVGGSVLDVGCGGGAAAVALVPPAARLTGFDPSAAMLANFAAAARSLGVAHSTVEGWWPDDAARVPPADVVVCHHVVYNVAAIVAFVDALARHARRRVVVVLSGRHPSAPLKPLWERFWGLARPDGPSADLFVDVVREAGFSPTLARRRRPVVKAGTDAGYVAFVRRRLCLGPERDPEIVEALGAMDAEAWTTTVTVWWDVDGLR